MWSFSLKRQVDGDRVEFITPTSDAYGDVCAVSMPLELIIFGM